MTNRELYKQAFSPLHASVTNSLNTVREDNVKKVFKMKSGLAACIALFIIVSSVASAYAADVGGIRETIQLWIYGKEVDATVIVNKDNSYTFSYRDEEAEKNITAGGVSLDEDGEGTALSAEEVAWGSGLYDDVVEKEDGSIWLYYYSYEIDITDLFENNLCKVALNEDGEKIYFDITKEGQGFPYGISKKPQGLMKDYNVINVNK